MLRECARPKTACVLAMLLVMPALAQAQERPSTVRATATTAVLEEPRGSANAVGTVNPGAILEVLDERDGWYLVRPPAGEFAGSWRTGWVSQAMVTGVNAAPVALPSQSVQPQPRVTANRKGFIVGFGAGVGTYRAPEVVVLDRFGREVFRSGGENELGAATDFKIGYAPGDQLLLYYSSKVVFVGSDTYDAIGVGGLGVTYMFKPTSPSAFISGVVGAGVGIAGSSASDTGPGFGFGAGFEFARRWSLEGDVAFARLGDEDTHRVFRVTFNYLFY